MLVEFSLEKLGQLDGGRVLEAVTQAIRRAVDDCEDRPGVLSPRNVRLTLAISPVCDEQGQLDTVQMVCQVTETIPSRKSKKYSFEPRRSVNGVQLLFNDLSDDNVHQMTIDMENKHAR